MNTCDSCDLINSKPCLNCVREIMYEAFRDGIYQAVKCGEQWRNPIYSATYNVLVDNMPDGTMVDDWIEKGVSDAIKKLMVKNEKD